MYLYEGNEINDYFLVTGDTVEKSHMFPGMWNWPGEML